MVQVWVQLISPLSNQVGWRKKEYVGDSISDIIAQLQGDFPDNIRENFFEGDPPIWKPCSTTAISSRSPSHWVGDKIPRNVRWETTALNRTTLICSKHDSIITCCIAFKAQIERS